MPIRKENRSRYPKNWTSSIVPAIRARAGDRCECVGQCGGAHDGGRCNVPNGAKILRHRENPARWMLDGGEAADDRHDDLGFAIRPIVVVLTVAHLDHVPEHVEPENLRAMCQRCHLCTDRHEHGKHAAETRRARSFEARAAGTLFPI